MKFVLAILATLSVPVTPVTPKPAGQHVAILKAVDCGFTKSAALGACMDKAFKAGLAVVLHNPADLAELAVFFVTSTP